MIRNAVYYCVALLAILIIGFWPSYYSDIFSKDLTIYQSLHGAIMTLWVFLLIAQTGLIKTRKNHIHKKLGLASIALAPLVFGSGWYVNIESTSKFIDKDPFYPLAFFWLGYWDVIIFAVMWWLALKHRKNMALHSRYMMMTCLVFLMPGLGRGLQWGMGVPFEYSLVIPALIALGLTFYDRPKQGYWKPWWLSAALWSVTFAGFHVMPGVALWKSIAQWHIELMGLG